MFFSFFSFCSYIIHFWCLIISYNRIYHNFCNSKVTIRPLFVYRICGMASHNLCIACWIPQEKYEMPIPTSLIPDVTYSWKNQVAKDGKIPRCHSCLYIVKTQCVPVKYWNLQL
mgnify:CR=1 FL=1